MRTYVVEIPRRTRPLFQGDRAACLAFIDGQTSPAMTRLGLVVSAPPPAEGPDALVCVPAAGFGDWEATAAEVGAAWEKTWLLIESMPARHRDEARGPAQCCRVGAGRGGDRRRRCTGRAGRRGLLRTAGRLEPTPEILPTPSPPP